MNANNCIDFVRRDLAMQHRLQNEAKQKLTELHDYRPYRVETMRRGKRIYTSVCKKGDPRKLRLNPQETKEEYVRMVRICRFLEETVKRTDNNILAMEEMISRYQSLEPEEISKGFPRAYLPVPEECRTIGNDVKKEWLSQHTINQLVFEAAGPGASQAGAEELAKKLQKAGSEKLNCLADSIGKQRLHDLLHPYHPESLLFHAQDGTLVRSKSEAILIDIMNRFHVKYRYEDMIMSGSTSYYIDFTMLLPYTGKLAYLDHAGMVEKDSYRSRMNARIGDLIRVGIVPGQNYFITCDPPGGAVDVRMLELKILYIMSTDF